MNHGPAIVTGGGGTLGVAIGKALAARGLPVALLDRDRAVEDAAREIGARAIVCDVTVPADRERAMSEAGAPSVLVNCAGIGRLCPVLDVDAALWDQVLAVNLTAPFFLSQIAARAMAAAGGGVIVNIASVSGLRAGDGRTAYGVSKAGLIHLTRQLAVELAPLGITANAVAPGPVEGPLARGSHPSSQVADYLATIPQARYAEPEEIAEAVAYLASPAARHVTGQCLAIDGGWSVAGVGVRDAQTRFAPAGRAAHDDTN